MPMIGCGLDQLIWEQVKEMLNLMFSDTEIQITLYKLLGQQGSNTTKSQTELGLTKNTSDIVEKLSPKGEKADEDKKTTTNSADRAGTAKACTILPGEQIGLVDLDSYIPGWSKAELRQLQNDDNDVREVIQLMANGGTKPAKDMLKGKIRAMHNICGQWDALRLRDGLLYRLWYPAYEDERPTYQLIAPHELKKVIFKLLHSIPSSGHLGLNRTMASVRSRFYWSGCKTDIKRWLRACDECAQVKPGPGHKAKLVQSKMSYFLERISIDIVGELPETEAGNKYILSVTDYFTKWAQAYPLPDQTAQSVADVLVSRYMAVFGCPSSIHSDQGSNFQSNLFAEVCRLLNIEKTRTTPYSPKSDGLCERWNKTVQQMLKKLVNENRDDWDEFLPYVTMAYNGTQQESTGISPRMMVFGSEMPIPLDVMIGGPPEQEKPYQCQTEYVEWLKHALRQCHELAQVNLKSAAIRQKRNYDKGCRETKFEVGAFVWRWYPPAANRKLGKGWTGPYRVIACPSEVNCVIQKTIDSPKITVHIDHLKPHLGRIPMVWQELINVEEELNQEPVNREGEVTEEPPHNFTEEQVELPLSEQSLDGYIHKNDQQAEITIDSDQPSRPPRQRKPPDRLGW